MRISTEWLGELVALPDNLDDALLLAGLNVEGREGDVLELEITSNRGDWLSALGIAREIGALTGARVRPPFIELDESGPPLEGRLSVSIENAADCARYVARLVEGVQIGPSPDWMQRRLEDCGVRPINNVVDVSNYVMLEMGQPLHCFDWDKIGGAQIVVRRSHGDEVLTTLDEVERVLTPEMLAICDANGPIAIAGVMGGADSQVTDSTRNVLIESAYFAPQRVRRNAYLLGLSTEASRRFERHVDPGACRRAADRAAQLLSEIAGGRVAQGAIDRHPAPMLEPTVQMRVARCNAVLGLKIPREKQQESLERLGFKVSESEGVLSALVPTWRRDIEREIDLIEEVARLYGYDRVPITLHQGGTAGAGRPLSSRLRDRARSACLRCGLTEITTYSLSNEAAHEMAGVSAKGAVRLRNPLSEDYTMLRTSLVPSILDVLRRNKGRRMRAFEIGKVYFAGVGENALANEKRVLGIALSDAPARAHWQKGQEPVDFYALKAIVENVLREFGAPLPMLVPIKNPALHPGRAASIALNGVEMGFLGEIHPQIAAAWDLPGRAYIARIDFDALVRHVSLVRQYQPFSKFPTVERDLALLVPAKMPSANLTDAARRAGGSLLQSVDVFDVYDGQGIPEGFKSVAIGMSFRASERTLVESEIEEVVGKIIAEQQRLGAQVRGA